MAIPASGYDSATISNPSSAETDFTLLIDLSTMSADFKSNWNTDTGGYGKAAKNDGTTELATDWINIDSTAKTGWVRVKWSGTLASSGTQIIRIFPPNTANDLYSASDTYGSDNAYDSSWEAYLPLQSDFLDRTSNGNDGTGAGGISAGDSTGHFGNATEFDGSADTISLPNNSSTQITGDMTLTMWVNLDVTTKQAIIEKAWSHEYFFFINAARLQYTDSEFPGDELLSGVASISTGSWLMLSCVRVSGRVEGFIDGSAQLNTTAAGTRGVSGDLPYIGSEDGAFNFLNGLAQDCQLHSTARSDGWMSEEFDQTDDQSTFWGTWAWTSPGGTTHALAGSIKSVSSTSGSLNLSITLDGDTASVSKVSGALILSQTLDGNVKSVSKVSGALLLTQALNGDIKSISSVSGELRLLHALSVSLKSVSQLSGDLTVSGPTTHELEGSIKSISVLSGALNLSITLDGESVSVSHLSGALTLSQVLNGSLKSISHLSGNLTIIGEGFDGPICIEISSAQGEIEISSAQGEINISGKSGSITITQEVCDV